MGNDSGPDPLSPAKRISVLRDHLEREKSRRREAEAKVLEYENAITWNTSCLSCARVLDSAYAETIRREEAEVKLDRLMEEVTALRALALANGIPLADLERIRDVARRGEGVSEEAPDG